MGATREHRGFDGRHRGFDGRDLAFDESDFPAIGEAIAAAGLEIVGTVGTGTARLMRHRAVVDLAVGWMTAHRG